MSDERLVGYVRTGNAAAFEAIYDRHHKSILSFCRHLLGSPDESEDAVQHTFLVAYDGLRGPYRELALRPWLFAIARNRCYTILRARREYPTDDLPEIVTEGLATQVQRRQDLRDLVADLGRLPDDQRAALVLAEMQSMNHDEIAEVLGVPRDKVKALVFQAREALAASRQARDTSCAEIRTLLANQHGGALRRGNLRRHLHACEGCRAYRREVEHQHRRMALLLPVAPTLALKDAVLAATVGGGAAGAGAAGTGLVAAGTVLKGAGLKGMAAAVIATVGAAGTFVTINATPANHLRSAPAIHAAGASAAVARIAAAEPVEAPPQPTGLPGAGVSGVRIGTAQDRPASHVAGGTHASRTKQTGGARAAAVSAASAGPSGADAATGTTAALVTRGAHHKLHFASTHGHRVGIAHRAAAARRGALAHHTAKAHPAARAHHAAAAHGATKAARAHHHAVGATVHRPATAAGATKTKHSGRVKHAGGHGINPGLNRGHAK